MPHFARNEKLDAAIDADPDEANHGESSGRGGRSRDGQRDDGGDPEDRYIAAYE